MSEYDPADYTYLGLDNYGKPSGGSVGLIYLVSLVDSPSHAATNAQVAKRILTAIFDMEEQLRTPAKLMAWQDGFLPKNLHPLTPCMLTKGWSPIGAMLQQGFTPVVLSRDSRKRALATGIWKPFSFRSQMRFDECKTSEQLFWSIIGIAFERADERRMLVNIVAKPGWGYEANLGMLPEWSDKDLVKAERILWKRAPEDYLS